MIDFFSKIPEFNFQSEDVTISNLEKIGDDYGFIIDYINIIFVDDEELLEMNKQFLKHDYYTDIITFDYSEEPKELEAELYISIDRVKENAIDNCVSFREELLRVITHGMLHLVGFGDFTVMEKEEMREKENYYLKNFSFHVKPD